MVVVGQGFIAFLPSSAGIRLPEYVSSGTVSIEPTVEIGSITVGSTSDLKDEGAKNIVR